ncbi:MAG: class I SAM-dependent methyltransferase [Spartobacteria bacterium]|nr:class I SAM-dependent methyltransferase [Spartobacteria bacterium]
MNMPAAIEFDTPEYAAISAAREAWLRAVVAALPIRNALRTALDVGCGGGHFSGVLAELGFQVTGTDLREENLRVCRERYPRITFERVDLDAPFAHATPCDLVLMFGILYHLESPLQTIRHLSRAIGRVGIVSTRVAAGHAMAAYYFNEKEGAAHNTAPVTAIPTFPALLRLFQQAGFTHIYRPEQQPDHPQWRETSPPRHGQRHSFIVAREPLNVANWQRMDADNFLQKWQHAASNE